MAKIRYVLVGFGGIAENRVAKEGYACDKKRFKPLKNAVLVGATDLNPARQKAAEALKSLAALKGCQAHCSVILSPADAVTYKKLGLQLTCEPQYQTNNLYHR